MSPKASSTSPSSSAAGSDAAVALATRSYRPEDRDAVVTLWTACGLVMPWNDPDADIARAAGGPASDILVGEIDGAVVATAMVGDEGHRGWVYYVAVDPERQGHGLGAAMMAAAEAWHAARGVPKVMLLVRETNTRVVGFYEGLGYVQEPRVLLTKWVNRPQDG